MSNSFDKQYEYESPAYDGLARCVPIRSRPSVDVEAYEWLHGHIGLNGEWISPLGRRWLINALGHLSDNLDAYLRSGAK